MRRIVTISYTGLEAGGGVPKFNRDIHGAFPDRECVHFCWTDFPWYPEIDARGETEWGRARTLNEYLVRSRLITTDDAVIADGFWAAGLEHLPFAISHSHGIWSHLTKEDVDAGKHPDMPYHHAAQVAFRQRWTGMGKYMTAVSDFIADQLRVQWNFRVDRVINNGVDTAAWYPLHSWGMVKPYTVVHGINDRSNTNKGWDHIEAVINTLGDRVVVYSLDELSASQNCAKNLALASADLFIHPSGYEGNSMLVAEALACGVPFLGYNVGFAYWMQKNLSYSQRVGVIMDRQSRSPQVTANWAKYVIDTYDSDPMEKEFTAYSNNARMMAETSLSLNSFKANWRGFISEIGA